MLDASIPLRTNPVQLENPMQQMGNVLALKGGMQRNQLAEMQMKEMDRKMREQEAVKGILADPAIGGDFGRASNALLSQGFVGPAMELQKNALEQRKANASISKDEAETSLKQLGVLGGIFSQLANNPAATTDDIIGALTTARAAGVPADVVTNIAQQIPRNAQAVPQFVRGLTMATKQGMDALKAMLPTVQTQDTGGQVQILNTNPLAGPVGPMAGAQPLAKTATPGDLLTDTRTRQEGAANRGVQIRGQDITARGQDLTNARALEQYRASIDPDIQGRLAGARATATEQGKATAQAIEELPQVIATATQASELINQMIGSLGKDVSSSEIKSPHPGFRRAVGATLTPGERFVEGSPVADFMGLLDQVKGGAFLQAFQDLKGGGHITNIEGEKATLAMTRMDKALSEKEFIRAAREYEAILKKGVERAKRRAAQSPAPSQTPGSMSDDQLRRALGL